MRLLLLLEAIGRLPLHLAVCLGTILDHSGVPLFLVAGAAAAPALELRLLSVAGAGVAGALIGDLVLLVIGRTWGRKGLLSGSLARRLGRTPDALVEHVSRVPVRALTLYRYIPAVGKYAPLAAGMGGVGPRRAVIACAAGSAVYGVLFTFLGWLLQPAFIGRLRDTRLWWGPVLGVLGLVVAVAAGLLLARRLGPAAESLDRPVPGTFDFSRRLTACTPPPNRGVPTDVKPGEPGEPGEPS